MPQTLHIVRHAQGYHQLPLDHPDTTQRDPELTTYGIEQAVHFSQSFPHHGEIDLLCASPMKRTIRTALVAFEQDVTAGRHIVLLPDAQEATADASDTGSEVAELQRVFGDVIDVRLVEGKWYEKAGAQAIELGALRARAARLRKWLRSQEKESVVLVTHGLFAHYLTGNIQDDGGQTGMFHLRAC